MTISCPSGSLIAPVTSALFLGQDVNLGLELGVRRDRPRLGANLTALDVLPLSAAEQQADVVSRLALIEQLAEHLDAGHDGLPRVLQAADLDFLADLDDAALDAAGDDRAAAGDREDVFDRHQEVLVDGALRHRDVVVDGVHQLHDLLAPLAVRIAALQRLQRGDADDWDLVARELVLVEIVADLHLHEIEQLRIRGIDLVQCHHDGRYTHLASQQNVFLGLRHDSVSGGHDEDCSVHLRGAGDHVLDVVGVSRTIDVRVVALGGRVLDVRGRDGDAALALLGSLVDLVERNERRRSLRRQNLRDGRGKRGLSMVDVADGADVHVRFTAVELFFGHLLLTSSPES